MPGELWRTEDEESETQGDDDADVTFKNMGIFLDFMDFVFGLKSMDGKGGDVIATVHFGFNFGNAYWLNNLKQLVFGDGFPNDPWNDGEPVGTDGYFGNYGSALDITCHELMHGVISFIAGGGE